MSKSEKSNVKTILVCSYIILLILYGLLLFKTFTSNQAGEPLKVFDNYYWSTSDQKGSLGVISEQEEYLKGDLVLYKSGEVFKSGTIDSVTVQNNVKVVSINQEFLSHGEIIGKLTKSIPILGAVLSFLQSVVGIIVLVITPCAVFLVFQIISLRRHVKHKDEEESYENIEDDLSDAGILEPGYTIELPSSSLSTEPEQAYEKKNNEEALPSTSSTYPDTLDITSYSDGNKFDPYANEQVDNYKSKMEDSMDNQEEYQEQTDSSEELYSGQNNYLPQESIQYEQKTENSSETDGAFEEFMSTGHYGAGEGDLENLLSEMQYKMQFQDTRQFSKHIEGPVEEQEEKVRQDLDSYGLQTNVIDDGIEISIDRTKTQNFTLRLKKDGSLTIITETYHAEITSEIR